MKKQEFIEAVKSRLRGLSEEDINKALEFYTEAIDDRIDEGLDEDQAVSAVGTPEEIADQILMDTPLPKLVKAKAKPSRALKVWEIILIILGAPLWIPIIAALLCIVLAVIIVLMSLGVSVVAVVGASALGGIAVLVTSVIGIFAGEGIPALFEIGMALVLIGAAVLLFAPVKAAIGWIIRLIGRFIKWLKRLFIR